MIVIAVPTFRRPAGLRRLLDGIAELATGEDFRVLVAENDADGKEGLATVENVRAAGYRVPLAAITVTDKGLCHVRNALVREALADESVTHVAMLDDDEWPSPHWLDELLRVQRKTGADLVGGPMNSVFDGPAPGWASRCKLFLPLPIPEGPCAVIGGAGNVIFTRRLLEETEPPWFDPEFNTTGGEDMDAFTRWRLMGRRSAWAAGAIAHEAIPADRLKIGWVMRRSWRIGMSDIRIELRRLGEGRNLAYILVKTIAGCAAYTLLLTVKLPFGQHRVNALADWTRSIGKLFGLIGGRYHEYA